MNDELKAQLRKIVFEALTNAAEGDTAEEQYRTGPTDAMAQDLFGYCADVQEFATDNAWDLLQPNLEELVEEWKAAQRLTQKVLPSTPAGRLQLIGDLASPQVVDGEVLGPLIPQTEARKLLFNVKVNSTLPPGTAELRNTDGAVVRIVNPDADAPNYTHPCKICGAPTDGEWCDPCCDSAGGQHPQPEENAFWQGAEWAAARVRETK